MTINMPAQRDSNNKLQWKIPVLYFDQRISYKICVHVVHTVFDESVLQTIENNDSNG